MSARERQTRCKKGVCQLLRGRPTAQPGAPLQPGIPGGAKAAAGLVRGLVFRAEARAQLSARFATRLRGSGRPLPLVGDRIEPEANDKIRRMTPVGVFFCWQGGAERDFVNSTKLTQLRGERRWLSENEALDETMDAIRKMTAVIKNGPEQMNTFDEDLFDSLVEKVIAESQTRIRFRLCGGLELAEQLEVAAR